jgi:hypothetical protein
MIQRTPERGWLKWTSATAGAECCNIKLLANYASDHVSLSLSVSLSITNMSSNWRECGENLSESLASSINLGDLSGHELYRELILIKCLNFREATSSEVNVDG